MLRILLGLSFIFISSSAFADCDPVCSFSGFQKEQAPNAQTQDYKELDLSGQFPIEMPSGRHYHLYLGTHPIPDIYRELDQDPYRPFYTKPR